MASLPDFSGILESIRELDRIREKLEEAIIEINKVHKKLQNNPEVVEKPGDHSLSRLRSLYIFAKEISETEVSVSNTLVNQIDAMLSAGSPVPQRRRIGVCWNLCCLLLFEEGNEQKKRRVKADSDISRLLPSLRSQLEAAVNLKGEQVAARVTPDDAEKDEWFVVKVMHFDRESRVFDVLDEEPGDEEEGGGQRKYRIPISRIIAFPKKNDSSAPDFPPRSHVLAVYPGTTALYRAVVVTAPIKRRSDDYVLEFDDDEEDGYLPQRTVPFHRVVALPEGHRQ